MPAKIKQHKPPKAKDAGQTAQANNRQRKRTFHTGSKDWATIRRMVLQREPLCRECKAKGLLSVATVVDHIDGDSTNNHLDNLQSLDATCHNRKTRLEQTEKSRGTVDSRHAHPASRTRPRF